MAEKKITVIQPTVNPRTKMQIGTTKKRKVAGYARVSTDSDEQFTSFEAQRKYYTNYIRSNPAWEFVDVYTDEGISGTNTKHREGFNKMISDALSGKIDLIVTKSVSRFARNTVDSLVTIRQLKEHNVEVYFEKEAIYTFDGKGELLLTIMSSLAQEESRSISENVTWGQRKRFADGKVSMPYKAFLGYEKGENGIPVINKEQAELVRRIYSEFMHGQTPHAIAKRLTDSGVPAPRGGSTWRSNTIRSILTNEKYRGSALLQKSFTVDFLTHKKKINEGEIPQYYVENSHEAIIPPEEWDAVQDEIQRRKNIGAAYSGTGVFASKLICADCGGYFGSKVWHSNDKYCRVIWRCNRKYKGADKCRTKHLTEDEIKAAFIKAYNTAFEDRESIIADCKMIKRILTDTSTITAGITDAITEIETVSNLIDKLIAENTAVAQDQGMYNAKYAALCERYDTAVKRHSELETEKARKETQAKAIDKFIALLRSRTDSITEFDESLWLACIENVLVGAEETLTFNFIGGKSIEIKTKE